MNLKKVSRNFGVGALFCFTLFVGFIMQIVCADEPYSETENRSLETKPEMDLATFLNKNYQTNFENYVSDQFPNRSRWAQMKTFFDLKMGIRLIQDVYVAKDMLIQKVDHHQANIEKEYANTVNEFKKRYPNLNFNFILVPNKIEIYKENLPDGAVGVNQAASYEQFYQLLDETIHTVDALSILEEHKDEYIFYKSDHHWTTLAAKYVADAFLGKDEIAYDIYTSNDQFRGTLANKITYFPYQDRISLYIPQEKNVDYVVDYVESKQKTTSVYDLDKQLDSDAYGVYFGGNHPLIKINTTANEDKRLIVFKDSYANCFIPFLLPYYSEIVIVDPRYYYGDIDTLMKDEKISDVLFLYNMNTFFSDDALLSIKAE
ncbi:MAG: hypothetical protein EOM50_04420 [Erysipelotrichia bacterium]|nr:hypothetical protein [Erysipelotrichia bacterium]NCC54587.1 hypothetical protein [Erysipelotrichia bacterium]